MSTACKDHTMYHRGCEQCKTAGREATRRHRAHPRNPETRRVPVGPIVEHIRLLESYGMGHAQIARISGIPRSTITCLTFPGRYVATVYTRDAILAVKPTPTQVRRAHQIPAIGPSRQVQALCARGFSQRSQAQMAQVRQNTLWELAQMAKRSVSERVADNIQGMYDRLECDDAPPSGSSTQLRALAKRSLWAPPELWTPRTIHDPYALPMQSDVPDMELVRRTATQVRYSGLADARGLRESERVQLAGILSQHGWGNTRIGELFGGRDHYGRVLLRRYHTPVEPRPVASGPSVVLVAGNPRGTSSAYLQVVYRQLVLAVGQTPGPHELVVADSPGVCVAARTAARLLGWRVQVFPTVWEIPCTRGCYHGARGRRPDGTGFCPQAERRRNQQAVDYVAHRDGLHPVGLFFPSPEGGAPDQVLDYRRRSSMAGVEYRLVSLDGVPDGT